MFTVFDSVLTAFDIKVRGPLIEPIVHEVL